MSTHFCEAVDFMRWKIPEESIMSNYSKTTVKPDARTELHDILSLTGAEVSINNLPAGAGAFA